MRLVKIWWIHIRSCKYCWAIAACRVTHVKIPNTDRTACRIERRITTARTFIAKHKVSIVAKNLLQKWQEPTPCYAFRKLSLCMALIVWPLSRITHGIILITTSVEIGFALQVLQASYAYICAISSCPLPLPSAGDAPGVNRFRVKIISNKILNPAQNGYRVRSRGTKTLIDMTLCQQIRR